MKQATLCVLVKDDHILLGMKKRGFGQGKYNGFGGKVNPDETTEHAVVRELQEESGITAKELTKVAEFDFYFPQEKADWNQTVHIYLVKKWEGEPAESEEMTAEWFHVKQIPYDKMWSDDKHWLPRVLAGEYLGGMFRFGADASTIVEMNVQTKSF